MGTTTETPKTRVYIQKRLSKSELDALESLVAAHGEEAVVVWLSKTPRGLIACNPIAWAKITLRSLLDPGAGHKATLLDVAADLLRNFGEPRTTERVQATPVPIEVIAMTVEHQLRSPSVEEDSAADEIIGALGPGIEMGVIERVGVWDFRLPSRSRDGAQQARISVIDLASKLGYDRKAKLIELIERHAEYLNKFGTIPNTYRIVQREGRGSITVSDRLLNRKQTLYVIAKSGTVVANELTVEFIDAADALLGRFAATAEGSILERTLELLAANQGTMAASQNTTNMLLARLLDRQPKLRSAVVSLEQTVIPQTQTPTTSDPATVAQRTEPLPAASTEPMPLQKLQGSGRIALFPKPGTVDSRDVPDAIHRIVDTVNQVTGWDRVDLFNSAYDAMQIELKWDPRQKPANMKTGLKYIGSQSRERKLDCYRIAYEILIGQHLR
jgi:hypothetical protein